MVEEGVAEVHVIETLMAVLVLIWSSGIIGMLSAVYDGYGDRDVPYVENA